MGILNDYMAMSYRMEIVEDKDEGGFVNFYPDLPDRLPALLSADVPPYIAWQRHHRLQWTQNFHARPQAAVPF